MGLFLNPIRAAFEPERSLPAASILIAPVKIGSDFVHAVRLMIIQNQTDQPVAFSFDGINNHLTLQSQSIATLDLCTNRTKEQGMFLPIGTAVWVSAAGLVFPATGDVFVSVIYAADGINT